MAGCICTNGAGTSSKESEVQMVTLSEVLANLPPEPDEAQVVHPMDPMYLAGPGSVAWRSVSTQS